MFSYSDRIGSLTPPSQRLPLLALETAGPRVMKTCVAALPFETLHLSELPWTQSNQIKMNQAKKNPTRLKLRKESKSISHLGKRGIEESLHPQP